MEMKVSEFGLKTVKQVKIVILLRSLKRIENNRYNSIEEAKADLYTELLDSGFNSEEANACIELIDRMGNRF